MTISLKLQKRLASAVLKCGRNKIWLDPNENGEISIYSQKILSCSIIENYLDNVQNKNNLNKLGNSNIYRYLNEINETQMQENNKNNTNNNEDNDIFDKIDFLHHSINDSDSDEENIIKNTMNKIDNKIMLNIDEEDEKINNLLKTDMEQETALDIELLCDGENKIVVVENENQDVYDECAKLMNRYYEELEKRKLLKEKLKLDEKEEIELLKKKRNLLQDKIVCVYGNYRTYKNIVNANATNIPDIFKTEYEYFENLNNDSLKRLETLTEMEIMETETYDDEIIEISNNFKKYMHSKFNPTESRFEHNWSELDKDVYMY